MFGVIALIIRKRSVDEEGFGRRQLDEKPISGPPQRTDGAKKAPSNLKGPPPKAMQEPQEVQTEPQSLQIPNTGTTVSDYSKLPGGGEYRYEGSQTFYSGSSIGSWKQNPDQSFTRTH